MLNNRQVYIWLNSLGISSRTIDLLEKNVDEIRYIWGMSASSIRKLKGIRKSTKEKIIKGKNSDYLNIIKKTLYKSDFNVITILDENYPSLLKNIYDPPKVLYIKGDIIENDSLSLAIVGSRKMTNYGAWATEKLVRELSRLGITIISGLALGIDTVAHKTCLENNGRTLAVLGNSLDIIYPRRNERLYKLIAENGALISEYFPSTKPLPYNFPMRNRIISGMSRGVVIIEAKEKSGSLITGYLGLEQGREVFAVPGNISSVFSRGTNRLIQDGAKLVMSIDDIIEEIYAFKNLDSESDKEFKDLTKLEKKVLNIIRNQPASSDYISEKTGLNIREVMTTLTVLEMKNLIKEVSGGVFMLL